MNLYCLKMGKAKENAWKKHDYEIKFNDSPECFLVKNCKMIQEYNMVKFICFDSNDEYIKTIWYPYSKIHSITKYE